MGDHIGSIIGLIKGDTRSLDYSSCISGPSPKLNPLNPTWTLQPTSSSVQTILGQAKTEADGPTKLSGGALPLVGVPFFKGLSVYVI